MQPVTIGSVLQKMGLGEQLSFKTGPAKGPSGTVKMLVIADHGHAQVAPLSHPSTCTQPLCNESLLCALLSLQTLSAHTRVLWSRFDNPAVSLAKMHAWAPPMSPPGIRRPIRIASRPK